MQQDLKGKVDLVTGTPCAAAMLAQRLNSPNLAIMFEAGSVSPQLPEMPISVGDSRASHKAVMDFEPESRRIISINPGYSVKDVQDN